MDKLDKITKEEANKLVFRDIKSELKAIGIGTGLTAVGSGMLGAGFSNLDSTPHLIIGAIGVLPTAIGLYMDGLGIGHVYHIAKEYISNPSEYIKKKYNKELV